MIILLLATLTASATETREAFDADGRVISHVEIDGAKVISEVISAYDDEGHLVSRRTTTGGVTTEQRSTWDKRGRLVRQVTTSPGHVVTTSWTFDGDGHETERSVYDNGALTSVTRTTWADDRKVQVEASDGGKTTVTTWAYDDDGRVIGTEARAGDGALTSAYAATYERPKTPVTMTLGGGVAYQTDVDLLAVNGAFSVARKPAIARFGADPVELGASVAYAYGRSKGETVNNQLTAHFGLDLNLVAPRTTPFLFVNVARNPVFNQNIDVLAAPVGVKFDLLPREVMKLDFSFAPVLNYRSIFVPRDPTVIAAGDVRGSDHNEDFLKLRGSFRLRVGYEGDRWSISDTAEYLPTLFDGASDLSFGEALSQDSILRNSFRLNFQFTDWMSLSNELVYTRDPTLAAQADCAADPGNLLCSGNVVTNVSTLDFTWEVRR